MTVPKIILYIEKNYRKKGGTTLLKCRILLMKPKKSDVGAYIQLFIIATIVTVFISLHMGYFYAISDGQVDNILVAMEGCTQTVTSDPFAFIPLQKEYFHYTFGLLFVIYSGLFFLLWDEQRNAHANSKTAQGSSKWNTDFKKYNKKYTDPPKSPKNDGPKNLILSQNVKLNMDTRTTRLNNNVLVIGGSGSGKTRFMIKPNLLQANCSYCITDPSGEILASMGTFLEEQGYKIKVFNLVEMQKSNCYNPFNYIRDDQGVIQLINCLIKNTNNGQKGGDPFWEKSETALLQAIIFYLIKHRPKEEQNFSNVMKLLRAATIDEDNPNTKSPLDLIYEQIGIEDPTDIGYKAYQTFKMGAGKTLKSILISCAVRLNVFNIVAVDNLTKKDDIDLCSIGDEKQALFVIIPAADDTFNFLVSMMYSQLFETLYFHAETECPKGYYIKDAQKKMICFKGTEAEADAYIAEHPDYHKEKGSNRVAHHVRFMLDEFANIGLIPDFEKKLATMRKYELSCTIILQNLAQLKNLYKDSNEDIIGNCDTTLFLGSKSYETLEYLSKMLGKTTIRVKNNSYSVGKGSANLSFNTTARDLMTPNELSLIESQKCIVLIRGLEPFFDDKFEYTKHSNYGLTGDAERDRIYDIPLDNSKELTEEELEKSVREQNQKKADEEMISDPKNTEEYIKDNKVSSKNMNYTIDQPESSKDMTVRNPESYKEQKEKEKRSVADSINDKSKNKDKLVNMNNEKKNGFVQKKKEEMKKNENEVKKKEEDEPPFESSKKTGSSIVNDVVDNILHGEQKPVHKQRNYDKDSYDVTGIPSDLADHLATSRAAIEETENKYGKKDQKGTQKGGQTKKNGSNKKQPSQKEESQKEQKNNPKKQEERKNTVKVIEEESVLPDEEIFEPSAMSFYDDMFS